MLKKLALAVLLGMAASGAHAAAFVNGGFESNSCGVPSGSFGTLGTGSNCITGWTVSSGSIDLINGYWEAQEGTHSVDLAGNSPGSISQTFDTIIGQLYSVDYFLSGNPDGGDIAKLGVVSAIDGGIVQSATFLGLQGTSRQDMNYIGYNFTFTATGAATTLSFASDTSEGAFGAALDAVSVSAVPEPTTWAMMLGGFGMVGYSMRAARRRKTALALG
jgi:choice-of-anchor C domain-containing protein